MKSRGKGCLMWGVTFAGTFFATIPMYFMAAWSFGSAYLAGASPDEKGWMVVLFPVLLIPSFLPWVFTAVPVAFAWSLGPKAAKPLYLFAAAAINYLFSSAYFSSHSDYDKMVPSNIGTIDALMFIVGVWIFAALGWFAIDRTLTQTAPPSKN